MLNPKQLMSLLLLLTIYKSFSLVSNHIINLKRHKTKNNYILFAKGKKAAFSNKKQEPPSKKEIQGKADQFDAITRKFMFTITKLTKKLPDSDRTILKNINLCFYPGAKIGVVGLNGSGKSSLLKIMAGVDKNFEGTAVPMPGASVGYLQQEPILEGKTVIDNINLGVQKSQNILDNFNQLSIKMTENIPEAEMNKLMEVNILIYFSVFYFKFIFRVILFYLSN